MRVKQAGIYVFGICLGLLAAGEGWSGLQVPRLPRSEKTFLRTEEIESARQADTRVYEKIYRVQEYDPQGNPIGPSREARHRYCEKGTGINYNSAVAGQNPVWMKTDSTIRGSPMQFDYMSRRDTQVTCSV